ncbi:UNVERIFIED_CONTAM: hypothetical protein NO986_18220 [Comamonas sp. A-3]
MKRTFLVAAALVALSSCGKSESQKAADDAAVLEIKTQRLAREMVTKHLKDPESASFRNQKGLCGEVNSKNSFGGYPGYRRFIAANENMVAFEGGNMDSTEFNQVWQQFCH